MRFQIYSWLIRPTVALPSSSFGLSPPLLAPFDDTDLPTIRNNLSSSRNHRVSPNRKETRTIHLEKEGEKEDEETKEEERARFITTTTTRERAQSFSLSSFTCINSTDKCLGIPEARFATIKDRALQRAKWKCRGEGKRGSGPLRIAAQMTARNRRSVDTTTTRSRWHFLGPKE